MILAANLLAALVILIKGLFFTINSMDRHTSHCMRISWICMTTGAFGILLSELYGRPSPPTIWETALIIGLAVYAVCDRRHSSQVRGMA